MWSIICESVKKKKKRIKNTPFDHLRVYYYYDRIDYVSGSIMFKNLVGFSFSPQCLVSCYTQ